MKLKNLPEETKTSEDINFGWKMKMNNDSHIYESKSKTT